MFSVPSSENITILEGQYSVPIVVLSIIIACAASYTALILNQRVKRNLLFNELFWMFLASIAMGLGIWSMHFIGMSAFMLPIPMKYNVSLTIISVLPAIFASFIAFYFANKEKQTHLASIRNGVVMGLGISSMHYIGMAAMDMEAKYYYKSSIFLASIAIAIIVSYVAILIFTKLHKGNYLIRVLFSILMGFAIASMHYVGMFSVVFYIEDSSTQTHTHEMHIMDMTLLIIIVTVGIFCLFALSGLTSLLGRYADYRLNYFDAITRLPNQRQFEKDLKNTKVAESVAIIQLMHLENWISAYGYSFGDEIIKRLKDSFHDLKGPQAKVYRIEWNRFAIINTGIQQVEKTKFSIQKVLECLKEPLVIEDYPITIGAVGAFSRSNGKTNVEELFANSMAVLEYSSNESNYQVIEFNPEVHKYNFERQIVDDIDYAMKNNELFLVYQPKISSSSKEVAGLEALIRWNHPTFGMISPGLFIPILEDKGKIFDVTDWVIQKVCEQIVKFLEDDIQFSHVSINIPGSYVTSPRLLQVVKENLATYNLKSRYIEFEITETSVIHYIDNAIAAIDKFIEMGVSVALDDFGTGLSSLSYLKTMPISTVKIDKSFVDGVPISEKDSAVLKAIIKLCHSLNLKVVVEGVETDEQFRFITSLGFDEIPNIQGYYFSQPLKVDELKSWMQDRD